MEEMKAVGSKVGTASVKHEFTDYIEIYGAREHNLKDIDLRFRRNQLVVITGISGSGKSSLAFDTLYAEGQRRYMESFSAYARSFIGNMERPDVDKINGLSPVISIEQKTTSKNPRSTVGTVTEVYDFMRLLFARAGIAYSYMSGEVMAKQTEKQILQHILSHFNQQNVTLLAPVVQGRKGHYRELFVQIAKLGYVKVRVDGQVEKVTPRMQLDRYKTHDIDIVIDQLLVKNEEGERIKQSVKAALKHGKGVMVVEDEKAQRHHLSQHLMDAQTGLAYEDPAPNHFSFNSPYGACPDCKGLGVVEVMEKEKVMPDMNLSVKQGGIAPLGEYKKDNWNFIELKHVLKEFGHTLNTPLKKMGDKAIAVLLYGEGYDEKGNKIDEGSLKEHILRQMGLEFEGVIPYLEFEYMKASERGQNKFKDFVSQLTCPKCSGYRLKKESLHFKIADKHIGELAVLNLRQLADWFDQVESRLNERQKVIAVEILKEIRKRIRFLLNVGLDYLALNRPLRTLSGGEAQRIRLATQIGTQLVGVLYILDEPSIGLHPRDNVKLIQALKELRDLGNTVIVVEHDKDMMLQSDHIIDIGPGAGRYGGQVVAEGSPTTFTQNDTITAGYLNGKLGIETPKKRRPGNGLCIKLTGAAGNNLKKIDMTLPLGKMICITGVSGSGKSSLIHETFVPILKKKIYQSIKTPLPYQSITGIEHIDKIIEIDQSPIGRTPRSSPATYTGVFTYIRSLFVQLPEAKIRGYKPGRFSFNVKGGRCEDCQGGGKKIIEMEFLPDVHVSCETCKGKRYNRETLEVRFKGKSIASVLEMTVNQALEFFEHQPSISRKIKTLQDVGLGYITLGQHATTLSGGEAQRVKLATELSKRDTGKTFYVLDEPTTGLHFEDVQRLLDVLTLLADRGNTVMIIEHHLDVIKKADHVIDLGPEGGEEGGTIIAQGTPEEVAKANIGYTAQFLAEELAS